MYMTSSHDQTLGRSKQTIGSQWFLGSVSTLNAEPHHYCGDVSKGQYSRPQCDSQMRVTGPRTVIHYDSNISTGPKAYNLIDMIWNCDPTQPFAVLRADIYTIIPIEFPLFCSTFTDSILDQTVLE
jgi:hypothetical protein